MKPGNSIRNRLARKRILFHGRFEWNDENLPETARVFGATIATTLNPSLDYLVLPDRAAGKTIQTKVQSLNRKGARIQVLDVDVLRKILMLTHAEVLDLLRQGAGKLFNRVLFDGRLSHSGPPPFTFASENFDRFNLRDFDFEPVTFTHCSFKAAALAGAAFPFVEDCDFSECDGGGKRANDYFECSVKFDHVKDCCFAGARLKFARFEDELTGADFTAADLEEAEFSLFGTRKNAKPPIFFKARIPKARIEQARWSGANFREANLEEVRFNNCTLEGCDFRNADLRNAIFSEAKLAHADFCGADLRGANLCEADLRGANFDGADLQGSNLRGAKLAGARLQKAKKFVAPSAGKTGPALRALDQAAKKAGRIIIEFLVRIGKDPAGERVKIDSAKLHRGWGLHLPRSCGTEWFWNNTGRTLSSAMLQAAHHIGDHAIRFDTLKITTARSTQSGRELIPLALRGITEAFGQVPPDEETLRQAVNLHRKTERAKAAVEKTERRAQLQREAARAAAKREKSLRQLQAKAGNVPDAASFHEALRVRADKAKFQKATAMLKASGFHLFHDHDAQQLTGVVKSQTDPDLVYACRLAADGKYACCTQNLNICGGLRGSICKHLLVLIIGLVQAGQLDPSLIDGWIAKTHAGKPELDKELMGGIFVKYKGAEAGEVDWRPTETLPEDYYAV